MTLFALCGVHLAIARVSGTIDTMVSTADKSMQTILDEICAKAVDKAVENGAVRETVKIAEMDSIPLQVRSPFSRGRWYCMKFFDDCDSVFFSAI